MNKLLNRVLSLSLSCLFAYGVSAKDLETVESLMANRTLNDAVDLHLTSDSEPIKAGVTVNITSADGWLFFDNIRPQTVLDNYQSAIQVNGAAFEPDVNGRIAIYRHGTVLMAHGSDFTPLEAFTETNFSGTSVKYLPELYYSNAPADEVEEAMKQPLAQDNHIFSFKLKRGYMVTLATEPDGMGYSRVYIADDADLELSELPSELAGKVSFIRVFNWEWASKKGWVGGNNKANPPEGYFNEQCDVTGSTWAYCWGSNADWCVSPEKKGKIWRNQEFVPEKWGYGGTKDWGVLFNNKRLTHLLSYNEPDHTEQSNVTVAQAIEEWPKHLQTGMRVGSPATTNFTWLYNFMSECQKRNYRVDYVAIHAYWGGQGAAVQVSSVSDWYRKLKEIHDKTQRPLWITEWNNGANWTKESWPKDDNEAMEKQRKFMEEILAMMDTCSFIERYSLYNWVEKDDALRALFKDNLNLRPAGKLYAGFKAAMAFNHGKEVVPYWVVREVPELSYTYSKEQNGITLNWTDVNCEQVDGYAVERAIGGGAYEELAQISFPQMSYTDPLMDASQLAGASVSYRVKSMVDGKEKKTSNVTSYSCIDNTVEQPFFTRTIIPLNYNFYLFGKPYANEPVVVLGTQSYRMRTPMTTRVRALDGNACEFGATLWNYNSNQTFSSKDTLALMVFPHVGDFTLGNIKVKAGRVSSVTDQTMHVAFDSPFDGTPAVFATQVSDDNLMPTAIRVLNVSKEGFDVVLQMEEMSAAKFVAEDVYYVAMSQGESLLGDKKIKVGVTPAGAVACSARVPYVVDYGGNYGNAVFFGAMQTMNDQVAATLRAVSINGGQARIFKDRETSGGNDTVSGETIGWCVVETDDVSTAIGETILTDDACLLVYDNAADEIRCADGSPVSQAAVYSVTGHCILSVSLAEGIDTGCLPTGIYVVRAGDAGTVKFIKDN